MLKKSKISLALTILLALVGANLSYAQPNIKNLTSSEQAEEVQGDVQAAASEPRIPGNSGKHPHSIGIGLGQTFLNNDFGDFGEDKITWDLFYTYAASHSFDLLANFHYSEHDLQQLETKLLGFSMSVKAKVFQFDAFTPFALGGLGFYQPQVTRFVNNQLVESESKLVFGFNLGLGADLRLNERFSVGVLGQLHNPFDVSQQDGTADIEGSYSKLLITGFYHF